MKLGKGYQLFIAILAWVGVLTSSHAEDLSASVKDPALAECLKTTANRNGWQSPDQVLRLKCHSQGIQSLQGLEAFSNLESLSLNNNKLQSFDIPLSSLKKLQMLNLARNNITKLSLANLPALQKLFVFGNDMKTFSLNNLPELILVKAHNNKLERFNYQGVGNLQKIYIFNNELETVDIYSAPKLQYMDCRQNPMPDELYDEMDEVETATFLHDGNADDWK